MTTKTILSALVALVCVAGLSSAYAEYTTLSFTSDIGGDHSSRILDFSSPLQLGDDGKYNFEKESQINISDLRENHLKSHDIDVENSFAIADEDSIVLHIETIPNKKHVYKVLHVEMFLVDDPFIKEIIGVDQLWRTISQESSFNVYKMSAAGPIELKSMWLEQSYPLVNLE